MLTLSEVMSRATPSGMKAMPIAKNAGRTVPAVIIGCHAGNFCCLNFVSAKTQSKKNSYFRAKAKYSYQEPSIIKEL